MSPIPPNPPVISLDDLKPGDVILSKGSSMWLDKLILLIDQGDYTHATQYIGKVDGKHMVVEATTEGIKYEDTGPDLTQDVVDVYRYVSPDGHHFGDPDWPVDPVLKQAKSFVGGNYAYSELLLGAVVIMASEIPKDEHLSEALRIALDYVEHQFEEWLTKNKDKTPMTCVQVVTSAHWLAVSSPANKYGLQVVINNARKPPLSSPEVEKYKALKSKLSNQISAVYPAFAKAVQKKSNQGITTFAGSDLLPLGSCTPRDMEYSPTLKFVGRIKPS